MKILVVSTSGFAKREGISTILYDFLSRFNKDLFTIHLLVSGSYNNEFIEEFRNAGVIDKQVPSRKKNVYKYILSLIKLFNSEKYDAIYIHGSSAIMCIELAVATVCGCKIRAVHSHNTTCNHKSIDMCLRPFFYALYTDAFACGNASGKWLFGNRKFTLVKNGRSIDKYSFNCEKRVEIRKKLNLDEGCIAIGQVGRLNYQKNPEFTINVFKELKKYYPDSKLYMIGDGARLLEIKKLVEELGLENDVVFTGAICNVDDYMQAMDAMILPSFYEGLPLVVVEWQISALPSIVSDAVTQECAYTNIVHFMSLNQQYDVWAKKIIEVVRCNDRRELSRKIKLLTINNGFDIDSNALLLQNYFLKKFYDKG